MDIIDDDEALHDSLSFLLRAAKFEVGNHISAVAFLDALPNLGLSCVITDVRMSDLSGIDLLKRLKELKVNVPVVNLTDKNAGPKSV